MNNGFQILKACNLHFKVELVPTPLRKSWLSSVFFLPFIISLCLYSPIHSLQLVTHYLFVTCLLTGLPCCFLHSTFLVSVKISKHSLLIMSSRVQSLVFSLFVSRTTFPDLSFFFTNFPNIHYYIED